MPPLRDISRSARRALAWSLLAAGAASALLPGRALAVPPWVLETVDGGPTSIVGEYSSMKLDLAGHPHIAYYDNLAEDLKYAFHDGTQWQVEVADGTPSNGGQFASLAVDKFGRPHIAYYDETIGKLRYTTKVSGSWIREIADTSSFDCGWYPSIALDSLQRPWIASYDRGRGNPRLSIRLGTNAWAGSTIDTTFDLSGFYASLVLDRKDRPQIAFYNLTRHCLQYAERNTGTWRVHTVDSSAADAGYYCSMAMDPLQRLHIAYLSLQNFEGDLKHATYDPSHERWNLEVVDGQSSDAGYDCSIAIDALGFPCIAYHDGTIQQLRVARLGTTGWDKQLVDDAPTINGLYTSIASDATGQLRVSYWDGTDFTLRFAWGPGNVLDAGPPVPVPTTAPRVSPNPAPVASRVRLSGAAATVRAYEIYDLAGRRTAEVSVDALGRAEWDTRTDVGTYAPAGLYFARARHRDGSAGERLRVVLVH